MKNIILLTLLIWLILLVSGECEQRPVYNFGFPPFFTPEKLQTQFTPLMQYLSRESGADFHLQIAKDYEELIKWLQEGKVSFAHLSPYVYVKATERLDLVLLATVISEGVPNFRGVIITKSDSPITALKDLGGRSFAFVDPKSSSGFIYPRSLLIKNGYNPSQFLGKTGFCKEHLAVIQAILAGEYEAGATYDGGLKIARREGLPIDKLKIIAQTELLPHDAYVSLKSVDSSVRETVQKALLKLNSQKKLGQKVLAPIGWIEGWEVGKDERYDPLRDLVQYGRERPRHGLLPVMALGDQLEAAELQKISELFMAVVTQSQRFFVVPLPERPTALSPRELMLARQQKNLDFIGEPVVTKSREKISLSLRLYECRGGRLEKIYVVEGKAPELADKLWEIGQGLASDHPLRGIVIESQPAAFTIDLGHLHGTRLHDLVEVVSLGEEIRHPISDEVIGRSEKLLGKGKAMEVLFDTARCVTDGEVNIPVGSTVKLYAAPPVREEPKHPSDDNLGTLTIISDPPQAHIWLDNKNTGFKTPHTFEKLPVKNYVVRLEMMLYQSVQQVDELEAGKEKIVSISLTPFHETDFGLWLVGLFCTGFLVLSMVGLRLLDWNVKRQQEGFKISPQKLGLLLEKLPYPLAKVLFQYKKGKLSAAEMGMVIDQLLTTVLLAERGHIWETRMDYEIPWETLREQLLTEYRQRPEPLHSPYSEKIWQFYQSSNAQWRVLMAKGISAEEWLLISGWRLIASLWGKKIPKIYDFLAQKNVGEELQACRIDAILTCFADFFADWHLRAALWVTEGNTMYLELKGIQELQIAEVAGKGMNEGHLYLQWEEKRLALWPYAVYLVPVAQWPIAKFFFLDKILPANGYFNNYMSYDLGVREEVILHPSYWKEVLPQWIADLAKREEVEKHLASLFEALTQAWVKR